MRSAKFHPGASIDYEESLDWYDARSPQAAAGFETAIEAALERIIESPERWPMCDDRHHFYILRKYPFSIVYRVDADQIYVIAIAHSSREFSYWQGRD